MTSFRLSAEIKTSRTGTCWYPIGSYASPRSAINASKRIFEKNKDVDRVKVEKLPHTFCDDAEIELVKILSR